ncbi:hypothetical protein CEXT_747261 [Caerostris extrusa]|uniref:Uncharacterized protein n=1 Tax=Caerostris extrusa TaxID=172846 RepID=A0AAV4MBB7_CAEEX|nr:hypothetical protein CEXT_747261 [Caerostris extrusa]
MNVMQHLDKIPQPMGIYQNIPTKRNDFLTPSERMHIGAWKAQSHTLQLISKFNKVTIPSRWIKTRSTPVGKQTWLSGTSPKFSSRTNVDGYEERVSDCPGIGFRPNPQSLSYCQELHQEITHPATTSGFHYVSSEKIAPEYFSGLAAQVSSRVQLDNLEKIFARRDPHPKRDIAFSTQGGARPLFAIHVS